MGSRSNLGPIIASRYQRSIHFGRWYPTQDLQCPVISVSNSNSFSRLWGYVRQIDDVCLMANDHQNAVSLRVSSDRAQRTFLAPVGYDRRSDEDRTEAHHRSNRSKIHKFSRFSRPTPWTAQNPADVNVLRLQLTSHLAGLSPTS